MMKTFAKKFDNAFSRLKIYHALFLLSVVLFFVAEMTRYRMMVLPGIICLLFAVYELLAADFRSSENRRT